MYICKKSGGEEQYVSIIFKYLNIFICCTAKSEQNKVGEKGK